MVPEKTRKMAYLKLLGLGAVILGILTVLFSQYTASWSIPEEILDEYREENIFMITWYEQPAKRYCRQLQLLYDGSTAVYGIAAMHGSQGVRPGNVTRRQQREFRQLLAGLRHYDSQDPFAGNVVITTGFHWQGEHYILSFNESSCPPELRNLLDTANEIWGEYGYSNPCQDTPDYTLQTTTPITGKHPTIVLQSHMPALFKITWFEQPFTGEYKTVDFRRDYAMIPNDLLMYYNEENHGGGGYPTEAESQEIVRLLAALVDTHFGRSTAADQTVITVGITWEADYHLLTFGATRCPDELQQLLEMSEDIMDRAAPGWGDLDNPCQEK